MDPDPDLDPLVRDTDLRILIRTKMSRIMCIPGAGEGWEEGGTPDGPEVVVDCAQVTGRPPRQVVRPLELNIL